MYSKELIRGTLKTIVLSLLKEKGRMYGYEMTRLVQERTQGEISLTFGALYPVLHKLEADGLLMTEVVTVDNRARKYYRLTDDGATQAQQKLDELKAFMQSLGLIFKQHLNGQGA